MTEAEKQLAELVSMPTLTDDITANDMILDYLEAYFSDRGMHCMRHRFSGRGVLMASTRKNNQLNPAILLCAHTDVIAGTEDQFSLRKEGDKLIGRGTYDMKFAIAGYMQLVDDLQDSLDDYDFGILIVSDEETADIGVKNMVKMGLSTGICILPDSTAPNYDIETIAKGYWRFDIIAAGRAAHGARPWEGESASFKLIQALSELNSHFDGQNVMSDSLNIGQIHGGYANNMVPSQMIAGIDIRYLTFKNLEHWKKLINEICKKYDLELREITTASPVNLDINLPLVQDYLDSVETITGRRPQNFISCAGSDAPYFYTGGIACVISCCEGGGHHTKNEWIGRKSFLQFVPILKDYLDKTAKIDEPVPVRSSKTVAGAII